VPRFHHESAETNWLNEGEKPLQRRTPSAAKVILLAKWIAGFSASFTTVLVATSYLIPNVSDPPSPRLAAENHVMQPEMRAPTPTVTTVEHAPVFIASAAPRSNQQAAALAPKKKEYAQTVEVRKGDTLIDLLTRSGVRQREAVDAIEALKDVFEPQELMPGQEITLNFELGDGYHANDNAIQLASLTLQPSVERDLSVTRGDGGDFVAEAIERPLEERPVLAAAMIESSMFEAGRQVDVPPDILGEVIKAFSYDVDFQREIQPGDAFEIIYERVEDDQGNFARSGEVIYAALTLSGNTKEIFRFEPKDGSVGFYNPKGESIRKALLRTPLDVIRITSKFGLRKHPVLGYTKMHKGVDFAASTGTPIFASGDGTIAKIGRQGGYGNYIQIRHNSQYSTAYAHMSRFAKGLKNGSRVRQGDVIGYVGSTGRTTGPHLHYEILVGGKQVNPMKIKLVGNKLEGKDLKRFEAVKAEIKKLRRELGNTPLVASLPSACSGQRPLESC
jgi:murein DD-endopeptidase MepM/ murein hydrolase activator NlpD